MSEGATTTLLQRLAVEIGVRTAGSSAARAAANAVADSFHELGLTPRLQEFTFLGFEPEPPDLFVDAVRWEAGPCLYAPSATVHGTIHAVGELVIRRDAFETPVFAICAADGCELARLYVNTRGPAIPALPICPALLSGPAAWIGSNDGARLAELEGARASLRTSGTLEPGQVGVNVISEIAGESSEAVLVCAHFDSAWQCPGAIDNASGVEGLRRVAEHFCNRTLARTLILCAFGAEEMGLLGSTHYVTEARLTRQLNRLVAVLNLDSIGRGETLEVLVSSDDLRVGASEAVARLGIDERLPVNVGSTVPGSDHWPFVQQGIPTVALTYHPYAEYHTPAETIELVDIRRLNDAVNLVCALVEGLV